jgi:hypothetical protein
MKRWRNLTMQVNNFYSFALNDFKCAIYLEKSDLYNHMCKALLYSVEKLLKFVVKEFCKRDFQTIKAIHTHDLPAINRMLIRHGLNLEIEDKMLRRLRSFDDSKWVPGDAMIEADLGDYLDAKEFTEELIEKIKGIMLSNGYCIECGGKKIACKCIQRLG